MTEILDEHHGYLCDPVKVARYDAAIKQIVQPGHVVMDLGCGSGLLGLMALRAGAAKVIFVEESPIIQVARQTMQAAGFSDRCEYHYLNSFELELEERIDVVICDHIGYFGFDYGALELLADAKARFLKPDGVIIPAQIDLLLAPVESASARKTVDRWTDGSVSSDYAWVRTPEANAKHAVEVDQENLLAESEKLCALSFGEPAKDFLRWNAEFECTREGKLDGLLGWFDCLLCDGIRMTNSPTRKKRLERPQAFLPLEERVSVAEGDIVRADLMVRPADHIFAWSVELPASTERYSLTTFNGLLLDKNTLKSGDRERVAKLNKRGQARQIVLSYCDGERTIAEIESLVEREHGNLLASRQATKNFVRHVLSADTD